MSDRVGGGTARREVGNTIFVSHFIGAFAGLEGAFAIETRRNREYLS
jgi:hypothetical protein